jgi:hypothetical protein
VQSDHHLHRLLTLSGAPGTSQRHDLGRLTADNLLDAIGPFLQGDTKLIGIVVLLVDAHDAAERTGDVVERTLDYRH